MWETSDPSTPRSPHEFVTRHSGPVYGVVITQDQRTSSPPGKTPR
ncbi:hypothetical protein [Frankia sp. AgKG'84/4]|nr:hypothetical protein [Frankia sp. AgKG'84/4]